MWTQLLPTFGNVHHTGCPAPPSQNRKCMIILTMKRRSQLAEDVSCEGCYPHSFLNILPLWAARSPASREPNANDLIAKRMTMIES